MDDDAERAPQGFDILVEQASAKSTGGDLSDVILNSTRPSGVAAEPAPSAGSRKIAATTASGKLVCSARWMS